MSERPKAGPESGVPGLYGLECSNRRGGEHFTKNRFNSSFPMALLCYMGEKTQLSPRYLRLLAGESSVKLCVEDIAVFGEGGVFKGSASCSELCFDFEAVFEPFMKFVEGDLKPRADVVVSKTNEEGARLPLRPFEVKLTVVPDHSTASKKPEEWCSEVVVRPVATQYALLSLLHALDKSGKASEARRLIEENTDDETREALEALSEGKAPKEEFATSPRGPKNADYVEKKKKIVRLADRLLEFFARNDLQTPFLLQPMWWTEGESFRLRDPTFDYVVWSDTALFYVALDRAREELDGRPYRAVLRLLAGFYKALCGQQKDRVSPVNLRALYTGHLTLGKQTDKDFAVNGSVSRKYLGEVIKGGPRMSKADVLGEVLIEADPAKVLKPERRLDAALFLEGLLESALKTDDSP